MHAAVPSSSIARSSRAITYDAGSHNDSNMKYVRLVSANEQASTSYATGAPVMTTTFPQTQELFPNAQIITGTGNDGAIVEYVIDQRDFDGTGIPPTMYVEVLPNLHATEEDDEPRLNEEEVLAIENGYLNAIEAPVKKSRYSRMSEADRERYNARRRQRRLEKKNKKLEEEALAKAAEQGIVSDSLPVEVNLIQQHAEVVPPPEEAPVSNVKILQTDKQFLPIQIVKSNDVEEKSSKTETARNRYHAMTEEERRIYNQKRASAFRKKRKEEEILLTTPLDGSSPSHTSRAEEIVNRNARRAEKARQRYQRMTVEERREYNHRRTIAKKARRMAKAQALKDVSTFEPQQSNPQARRQQPRQRQLSVNSQPQQSTSFLQQNTYRNNFMNSSDVVNEEALSMLERDVVKRTHAAQQALKRQRKEKQARPFSTIDDTIEQVATYGAALPLNEPKEQVITETVQEYIEPSTLPLVIVDQHGNPANLPEGSIIEVRQEHPNGPQTIIIHTASTIPQPNQRFIQPPQPSMVQYISTSMAQNSLSIPNYVTEESLLQPKSLINESPELPKSEILRARRAARARERYHNMSEADRKQFNSRRAVALRKARVRDEELCRIGEEAKQTGNEITDETMKAIIEAKQRRFKRAESARLKYQKMTMEERRIYNANRDANRRAKKRDLDNLDSKTVTPIQDEIVIIDEKQEYSFE